MEPPKLAVVYTTGNRPEAELAKSTLAAAGIPAMIQSDTVGGMREHLAWSGSGFQLLVREEDATAAREVLAPSADALENGGNQGFDADFPTEHDPNPPSGTLT
jgi:hypothetical protein